jgi:NAD-dependent dihydropyrimidine dehydrogenase PreA subunit
MISIAIDEKACVGCSLCVETCVPGVFSFNEEKALPKVVKPGECFGCLACSQICPADAIAHEGVTLQECYYHDPYTLKLASRLSTAPTHEPLVPTDKAHLEAARRDLGVRLLSVAAVFKQTLGAGLPAVGTLAGRTLAGQLPRYHQPESQAEVLTLAQQQFAPAWDLQFETGGDALTISVGSCFVREVCTAESLPLGGELCVLFYNYLAGYLSRMMGVKPRLVQADRGDTRCTYQVKLY